MVAYRSFGSQRAPVAMAEAYRLPHPGDRLATAAARTRSGWAIVEQLFPGRLYDHLCACPLPAGETPYPEWAEVWLGEFGDTVMVKLSTVENQRANWDIGADQPVRAELVVADQVVVAYVDRAAGIDRFVEFGLEATRGEVRAAGRGEPLPFEQPFLDGPDDEVFPRLEYLTAARSWLFGISYPPIRSVPPAARVARGYVLAPVGKPLPLKDGRPLVKLPHPDELAGLLADAEMLDELDGRYVSGGGDWFQLHRVDANRALLVGNDVEDTESFFAAAVSYFSADYETDVLASVPEWWREVVHERHPGAFLTDSRFDPINILCGWDGTQWTKAVGAPDPVLLDHFLYPDED